MLDSLCKVGHAAKGKYASESVEFARSISKELNRTSKDIVENVAEILQKIKVKAGKLGDLGLHLEKELRNVADVDSLEHHLLEIANSNAKFVIMVDDLDLGWDNSELSNNLLLGLLSASSYIQSISANIHVIIYLREDVYSILMEKTQHSDKYRNIERIRWSTEGLISILSRRIKYNFDKEQETIDGKYPFTQVFPSTIGTHNTENWIVERTLSRPRELIQLSRFYTEDISGVDPDDKALKNCESTYSSWKLDDLCTEYSNQYPGLASIFSFWKTGFFRYKYHLTKDSVDDMVFRIFDESTVNEEWFNKLCGEADFNGFLNILYEIGFIGDFVLGGEGGSRTFYSFSDRHVPRFEEVQVHPCFRKAVNTVDRIRNRN